MADLPPTLLRLDRELRNPKRILKLVGLIYQRQAVDAFRDQALGGVPWLPRHVVNIAGAIEDLKQGPSIKERRFNDRPALIDRGSLLRSLSNRSQAISLVGLYEVEVGTRLPYAGLHQWGGESKIEITDAVRTNLAKYLKKMRRRRDKLRAKGTSNEWMGVDGRLRLVREQMGWLLGPAAPDWLTIKVPARPFLGMTPRTQRETDIMLQQELGRAGGAAGAAGAPVQA